MTLEAGSNANDAVNSPIGKLAQALMKDGSLQSSAGEFPASWLCKVESLLGIAGSSAIRARRGMKTPDRAI